MNALPSLGPWLAPLGWLVLETAVVVLAALAVQPLLRTAAARRSLWRAALLALVAILAAELTGTGSQLPAQLRLAWQTTFPKPVPAPEPPAPFIPAPAEPLPISDLPSPIPSELFPEPLPFTPEPSAATPPPSLHHSTTPSPPSPWPAFLWLAGLAALLARAAWTHAGFAWLRLRHFLPAAEALRKRVQNLAARLGLRRRVRVLASERLRAPAAFGWVRPGVAVPGDFTARFAPAQQDVMLAHELAHLAARDPLWQLFADLAVAALWWHPLAWVARHQHRLAAELAADDASQALPDGPVVLAECLLVLGQEAAAAPRAPLGMAGFRSQLGRRVERLVALPRRDWSAPGPLRLALQTTVALLALAALALLPGCAANRAASEAPSGIVAKWWQAKSKPVENETSSRPRTQDQRFVTSTATNAVSPPAAGTAALSELAREIDAQRKAMLDEHQRAVADYKKLTESATDPAVSIAERDTRKQAAEAKLLELQQIEVRIVEFDRAARARLSEAQRKPALPEEELAFIRLRLERVKQVQQKLLNPIYTTSERLDFLNSIDYAGRDAAGQITVQGRTDLSPIYELERTIREVERKIKELAPTYPPTHQRMQTLTKQLEALKRVLDEELKRAEAKFLLHMRYLQSQERKLIEEIGDAAPATSPLAPQRAREPEALVPSKLKLTMSDTVNPGDSLKLTVAEEEAFGGIYHVRSDGVITLPRVGRVEVGGKRLDEARGAVKALLEATQLRTATVTLTFASKVVATLPVTPPPFTIHFAGEFITTGPLVLAADLKPTLLNAITRSGGITPNGDQTRVKLLRVKNGQGNVEEFNVASLLADKAKGDATLLQSGDIIMVPVRPPVVHVTGSVVKPGAVSLAKDEKLTAYAAILRAGGFAPGASLTNCYVVRDVGNGEKARQMFNANDVQKRNAPEFLLGAGNIVVVPSSRPLSDAEKQLARKIEAQIEELEARRVRQEDQLRREGKTLKDAPPGAIRYDQMIDDLRKRLFELELRSAPPAPGPKPGASAPAPSPFAERGEKVAEEAATNAVAANLSPKSTPIAPQREREPEGAPTLLPTTRAAVQQQIAAGTLGEPVKVSVSGNNSQTERTATIQVTNVQVVAAPEAEALRRQERKAALDKLLGDAGQLLKAKSWTNAVVRYEEAVGLAKELAGVETVEKQYRDALGGLTYCRLQLAVGLQENYQFKAAAAEVDKIFAFDPMNAEAEQFKRFNERVEAAHKNRPAPQTPPAERAEVLRLVRDGRSHYEMGDLQKARTLLEEAIAKDPINEAAYFFLRLVQESQFERESKVREKTYGDRVVEVTKKWNEKTSAELPVPNPYFRTNSQSPFLTHSSKGAQRINRKLEEIVLPEVHFDAVPLTEVLKRLDADAKQFDPEKKGLNFLINDVSPQLPLLDAVGNPVPVARPVRLSEGLVRVTQPLKNLTLRQALDVICKTAELPTQFSVEEYAIAFIPRGPVAYFSRMFRVNPDTFIQGLQGVVGNPVLGVTVGGGNQPGAAGRNQPGGTTTTTGPVRATVPATVPATQRTAAEANALVRQFFQSAGVTGLGATNGSTRVTFNPENGLLLVRGTTNDLRLIEQAIQKVQPPLLTPTNAVPAAPTNALPKPNVYYRTNSWVPFLTHSSKGAQRINAKLDEIILPEVRFDSETLPEVAKWLDTNVRRLDQEKKGLNFLINNVASDYISLNSASSPAAPVLDPKGNPIASPTVKPPRPDLENALITVTRPIKDLTLRQVLDVICKTATVKMPDGRTVGLKFTVEEYAIVFSPKLPEQASLFARTFKVDPQSFITGLASVVDEREFRPGTRAALDQALREKVWTNAPAGTNRFSVAGTPLPNGVIGVANTNVTSELNQLVRAYFTAAGVADLGKTNGPDATQVFFNDRNGLLLVRASLQDLDIIQQAIELLNVKPPQVLIEAKLVMFDLSDNKAVGFDWSLGDVRFDKSSPTNKPDSANPVGIFPRPALPSGASGSTGSLTNKLVRTNAASVATITGILTAPQFAVVMRALEQRDAASVKSLPKVTTLSGKQATLEFPAAAKAEGGFAQGLKLEVLPSVDADGYTLRMKIMVTREGKKVFESNCAVWDAQTVMLGFPEAPAGGKSGAKPQQLMLFLTPTLIEPSGHRVHTDEVMPFAPAASPQPKAAPPGK